MIHPRSRINDRAVSMRVLICGGGVIGGARRSTGATAPRSRQARDLEWAYVATGHSIWGMLTARIPADFPFSTPSGPRRSWIIECVEPFD